ncbi:MAG: bifunctional oligoribonuclease/PAP phosphatase NrnA [Planctomycetota bacterium]
MSHQTSGSGEPERPERPHRPDADATATTGGVAVDAIPPSPAPIAAAPAAVSPSAPPAAAPAPVAAAADTSQTSRIVSPPPPLPQPRIEEFARVVQGKEKILVLTHDNPDPDAMAGAIGLYTILTKKFGIETFIGHGGTIGRAENKAMVQNLDLPIYSLPLLGDLSNFDGIVVVDTQVESKYHSLPPGIVPLAVFDHHPQIVRNGKPAGRFVEIRTEAGASATIVTMYLRAMGVEIPPLVATALMYGIRSDTANFQRHFSAWDLEAHQILFPLVDAKRLAAIEAPPLPREYYIDLRRGLDSAMIHGRSIVADLGELENPDMIALVADMLLRLDTASWAMVFGFTAKELRISVRTNETDGDAGAVVRKTIKKMGSGGGHGEMAAARIPLTAACTEVQFDILTTELVTNFLKAINESEHGQPLCRARKKGAAQQRGSAGA